LGLKQVGPSIEATIQSDAENVYCVHCSEFAKYFTRMTRLRYGAINNAEFRQIYAVSDSDESLKIGQHA